MPFPIVNSIISWFLKKRIHQIELFLKYPDDVQNEVLSKLILTAKNTEFGKNHRYLHREKFQIRKRDEKNWNGKNGRI